MVDWGQARDIKTQFILYDLVCATAVSSLNLYRDISLQQHADLWPSKEFCRPSNVSFHFGHTVNLFCSYLLCSLNVPHMVSQIDFPNSAVSNCLLASVGSVEKSSSYTKCYLNSAILFHTQEHRLRN